eukprot:TRINITY_DN64813_c0_g1_i1.p1 TRINITY_DN64813_c0_g1~~TRINITY_DN64813_c0_g1_i1.p1  ORF type:complete len:235 (-),score=50.14 TRINITY_DN64813_c0_g1_i1:37-741(-)
MVLGLRVEGSKIVAEEVAVTDDWETAQIPALLGIPLLLLRLGDSAAQGATESVQTASRLMTDPTTGIAPPKWQSGGAAGQLSFLAARGDGTQFTQEDLAVLDEYICWCAEEAEKAHRRGKMPPQTFTQEAFLLHLKRTMAVALENRKAPTAFLDLVPELELRFPKNAKVKARGLSKSELNGVVGVVAGRYDTEKGRVGIQYPEPFGLVSVRATNLEPEETYEEWSQKINVEYGF